MTPIDRFNLTWLGLTWLYHRHLLGCPNQPPQPFYLVLSCLVLPWLEKQDFGKSQGWLVLIGLGWIWWEKWKSEKVGFCQNKGKSVVGSRRGETIQYNKTGQGLASLFTPACQNYIQSTILYSLSISIQDRTWHDTVCCPMFPLEPSIPLWTSRPCIGQRLGG